MKNLGARPSRRRPLLVGCAILVVAALFAGGATGAPGKVQATTATLTVGVLPIANTLPLDLGIKKGFFDQQGIEIKKIVAQSGNDIMLGLANSNMDVGFAGWVPAMIARTTGIPISVVALSEVEGTNQATNWQNILVKGSSSIRTPGDLAGKTIAVNALKGVGEVMIKAALEKSGVDPNSIKLLALPFPAMRAALNNGQVDAIWTPEPFLSQAINIDGARDLMAPGPVLGPYFPIGGYFVRTDWANKNPGLAARFRTAMNQSLEYSQNHGDEIRDLLPAASRNIRLPIWTTVMDRRQVLQLAQYAKKYGVITSLPNFTQFVPSAIDGGKILQATLGAQFVTLRQDGKLVTTLKAGNYSVIVADTSNTQAFRLVGPGVSKSTSVKGTGKTTWNLELKKGRYTYSSSAKPGAKKIIRVI
jgi:NitT/TauT family transport system substrate-binding protein